MKIRQRARMLQKARWKPSFMDVFKRTWRKNAPSILGNLSKNNPFFERMREIEE